METTSAFSRKHSGHKPPATLLILFEAICFAILARFSWQRRGNKLLFCGLIAVIAMTSAIYFLMFRDVPLRPN
jgi:4-hydroxybenzoate polyprenyltransferase